jgi:hypothetical protein
VWNPLLISTIQSPVICSIYYYFLKLRNHIPRETCNTTPQNQGETTRRRRSTNDPTKEPAPKEEAKGNRTKQETKEPDPKAKQHPNIKREPHPPGRPSANERVSFVRYFHEASISFLIYYSIFKVKTLLQRLRNDLLQFDGDHVPSVQHNVVNWGVCCQVRIASTTDMYR